MRAIFDMPRTMNGVSRMVEELFGETPVFLVGAFAAAAYAPERYTKDVDYFVVGDRFEDAKARLRAREWKETKRLTFPNASLGLHGSAWLPPHGGQEIDLITSDQEWAHQAFSAPVSRDTNGERVIPLAYLVLMKLDSSWAIDQADLARILGRISPEQLAEVIRIVKRHFRDPSASDDLQQYHALGKWEYENEEPSRLDPTDDSQD